MTCTDFLFAQPGFLRGLAATLDMGATLSVYNESHSPSEADARALASDWSVVGEDIRTAITAFQSEYGE